MTLRVLWFPSFYFSEVSKVVLSLQKQETSLLTEWLWCVGGGSPPHSDSMLFFLSHLAPHGPVWQLNPRTGSLPIFVILGHKDPLSHSSLR